MAAKDTFESIELTDQVFDPLQARELLTSLIDSHINFYKLQYLQQWVGDHSATTRERDRRIEELLQKKDEIREVFDRALTEGRRINIRGRFEIKLID